MELKGNEMEKLYAETFHKIEEGAILRGKVLALKQDGVIVDIGYKSEGFIPIEEFSQEEIISLGVGSTIEVYVEEIEGSEGIVTLSKDKATKIKTWELLEEALQKGIPVEGKVVGKIKGGLSVNISGVYAFLPGSQIDIKTPKEIDSLIGKTMSFKILKLNNRLSNIVISRRAILEEERQKKKAETLEKLKEGIIIRGIVKNITDYGVFIDLGGIDGLLHISDISWGRINHPSEFFAIGDEGEVIVLKYDEENEKVTLGYKQKKPDPWVTVDERYPVGKKVRGKVVSITDYGAFIELEEGLEGLVHISEIDWVSRPKHPTKYLTIGETVDAIVLKADKEERRLSLSIKQLKPSPWEVVSQRYTIGQKISGKVKTLTDFGVFVNLPEGVDGLIHISDLSWTKHVKHPSELLRKGQKIEAVILSIEPDKERIALGLKQLEPDPWIHEIPEKFKLGSEAKGKVLRITDFGIFVELEGGVEGLIYSSEIIKPASGKIEDVIKEGDDIWVRIIKIDLEERKIGLSMKNLKRTEE
ncbi:MAG: 30S ribosomal protein S1 [Nitrospirota bacterium]|nr:30S ribosomal protein S1 [Nitrospirota bacterium]MDH5769275.1 30S ribosomal protein S1 [Nitrospirota bacterium]